MSYLLTNKKVGGSLGELRAHVLKNGTIRLSRGGQRIYLGPHSKRTLCCFLTDQIAADAAKDGGK